VWRALLQVRQGFWTSYGDLAEAMGKPKASRAIGGAVGANPLAVLVPCHRVMAADGRWNGYHWGLDIKKALIAIEAGDQSSDSTSFME
ncbi:MAG TPA: 6-O-methylguanine DNA methyltransferase, partial [Alphaproteobacteria bacterium]|nr:6-O-methylguanine DNA methyltransferase [Alphaproteobacteria bacterium]